MHKNHPETILNFYTVGRVLGRGAFGKVHLCLHKLSGKLLAMKSLHKKFIDTKDKLKKLQNEIEILKSLRNVNIIRLYETFNSGDYMLIVTELCGGGDLLSYIKKRKNLSEPIAKVLFRQVILAYHIDTRRAKILPFQRSNS